MSTLSRSLVKALRPWRHHPPNAEGDITFTGDFASWDDAVKLSTGYAAPVILERTLAAALKIKAGEAKYERDSVIFDEPQYQLSALAGILRAAVTAPSRSVSVVDVGGSLGSLYFQARRFLPEGLAIEWSVVEQPAYVASGRQHLEDTNLKFYESVSEALSERHVDTLLMSGLLQYLPHPYQSLADWLGHAFGHVVVDRTPFLETGRERLTIQKVPDCIYPASYPAWFFNEGRFTDAIRAAGYRLITAFAALDTLSPSDERAYHKGFIFERVVR